MRVKVRTWTPTIDADYNGLSAMTRDHHEFADWWTVYCLLLDDFEGLA